MRCYGKADGIPDSYNDGGPLAEDTRRKSLGGRQYKACARGAQASFNTYTLSALKSNQGMANVTGLASDPDGSLWVGHGVSGPGLGLQQLVHGMLEAVRNPRIRWQHAGVQTLFLDRNNALWVGTFNGIYRIHERQVDSFRSVDGLSGDIIQGLLEDREGNLWVATSKGIDMFRDTPVSRRFRIVKDSDGRKSVRCLPRGTGASGSEAIVP